ncbi:hypothetical protein GGI43DRAFT_201072 [Trichoderma evansii]
MSDETQKYPPAVTSYIQDDDGDLPYKLMVISNNKKSNEVAAEGKSTEAVQQKPNTVAADSSPISDTGTWEHVDHRDAN